MNKLLSALENVKQQLTVPPSGILTIAQTFQQEMIDGLTGKPSSLKMLPSYLTIPSGKETGKFLALDFGGTNVRVLLAELQGDGHFTIHAHHSRPLKDPQGKYNYISGKSTATDLFDFIARQIAEIASPDIFYPLGHTFSFPSRQTNANNAIALEWSKEIATQGVVGQDVNDLLTAALKRQGIFNVVPQVVLNDTVGTLLTAAYNDPCADIGCIVGTGHNTAYLEPSAPWTNAQMIINIESGNFAKLPSSVYDNTLDKITEKPNTQRLEKMCSGRYLGELVRLIAYDLIGSGLLAQQADARRILSKPDVLSAADVAMFIADNTPELTGIADWLKDHLQFGSSTHQDKVVLQTVASLVSLRSARLVAATFLGILRHIDPNLECCHTIGVDGSLYEKMPGYAENLSQTLQEPLQDKARLVKVLLAKDGSGIGAAVAVAITQNK